MTDKINASATVSTFPEASQNICVNPRLSTVDRDALNQITETVIGCAFTVSNGLGAGFIEKVYENALVHELQKAGVAFEQQKSLQVWYDGVVVGHFVADLLVADAVIVELKAVSALDNKHFAQCMNYLKATNLTLGLLINFGNPRVEVRRVVRGF